MKNLTTLFFALCLLIAAGTSLLAQGELNDERIWSVVRPDHNGTTKIDVPSNWVPAEPITRYFEIADATVGPNFRVKPGNTTQSELSIDVHPTNSNIVFGSANATNWPVSTLYGTGVYWSLDGGTNWTGFDNPPFGGNSGDPASVIGVDGRLYENYITNSYGQGVAVSTNNGVNWTTHTIAPNPGQVADKNHYMVDKTPTSPYVHRSYCSWTDFGGSFDSDVVLRYSTNFGQTWTSSINISGTLTTVGHAQGTNIQTGPNGEVYVAYAIYDAQWTDGEDAIGFSKSTDGGVTWTHLRAYNQVNFGIRGNLSSKNGIRVSSFPSMAVDRSGGPNNGTIYITWPQRANVTPAGNSPDIVLIKSTDGGATWTAPVRVNDDPLNNSKDQYYSWCTVDQVTGQLMLIFYDSRDVPNNQAEVFMANSIDGGTTFTNFKVSDQPHTPTPINNLAGGYAGDYIGIAALDDIAFPFWADNRLGSDHYQAWTASVTFGPPCPIDPPSNPSPANGASGLPLTGNTASWTNGAGASQIEVYFGQGSTLNLVYTGAPITTLSLAPFEPFVYNTTYSWQVRGKNDTCTVAGPIWSFTTMQDPFLSEFCDDFADLNNWTIVGPLGTGNWSANPGSSAGGTPPELYMNWSPSFVGVSTLRSDVMPNFLNNSQVNYEFKFYLDWYANPSGVITVGMTYDGGATSIPFYTLTNPTADVGPIVVQGTFTTPATGSENGQIQITYNGDSFNINWISFDDMCLDWIIPVELTSFTANLSEDMVELSWITATETNNRGFEVQKSAGGEFETIAFVEGHGTTTETQAYSYSDKKLDVGSYSYRLKQIDFDGTFSYSDVINIEVEIPLVYELEQNYPNPFNPSTTIKYSIPEEGIVKLAVYNMLGEEVATIVNESQKAGRYEVNFNATGLSSGVYVYRIEAANFTASKKLMLMK